MDRVAVWRAANLSLMSWAAHSITWGNAHWTNFHLGMDRMASVRLGDSPNCMFCTSTFSSDCNRQVNRCLLFSLSFQRKRDKVNLRDWTLPCRLLSSPVHGTSVDGCPWKKGTNWLAAEMICTWCNQVVTTTYSRKQEPKSNQTAHLVFYCFGLLPSVLFHRSRKVYVGGNQRGAYHRPHRPQCNFCFYGQGKWSRHTTLTFQIFD